MPAGPSTATTFLDEAERPLTALEARRLGPIRRWFAEHPRGTDIVVASLFLAANLTELFAPQTMPGLYWPLVALTTALLLVRRDRPLAVLVATLAITGLSSWLIGDPGGLDLAIFLATYTFVSLRPARLAAITTTATVVLLLAFVPLTLAGFAAVPNDAPYSLTLTRTFLALASYVTASTFVAFAIGTSVRSRREHTQNLVDRAHRMARERDQRGMLAAATERARIAREMHDVVAHSVSVMVALADGATASLDKRPEQARVALAELSATGRDALSEMRTILGVLRTTDDEDAPFDGAAPLAPTAADLEGLLARFRAAGLPVERVDRGPALPQQHGLALTMYRVVQESLTNVLRYAADASQVRLAITHSPEAVMIEVINSPGLHTSTPEQIGSGQGLLGLRERVTTQGGTLTAGPEGRGWRVRATLPLTPTPTSPTTEAP